MKNKEKMMKGSCEEAAYEKLDPKILKKSLENKEKHEKEATRKLPLKKVWKIYKISIVGPQNIKKVPGK